MSKPTPPGFDPAIVQKHLDDGEDRERAPGREIPEVPLAEHRNHTPFPSQYFQSVDQHGEVFHVVALRITYDMTRTTADGGLAYAEQQTPLATQDVWSGEVGHSSPLWESDYAPYKPRCDVLVVNAVSRPPRSEWHKVVGKHLQPDAAAPQAQRWPCGIALEWSSAAEKTNAPPSPAKTQTWHKQLVVTGPRSFGLLGGLSEPQATHEVAIHWGHAYGGEIKRPEHDQLRADGTVKKDAGADRWDTDERNPVGVGLRKDSGDTAPQQETSALNPYRAGPLQSKYPPISLGPLGRDWSPRYPLAGTYDDAWLKEQWPLPPMDFDYGYWNCAPQDQQTEYLSPGTKIHLMNLYSPQSAQQGKQQGNTPETWSGQLPLNQLFILLRLHPGPLLTQLLNLDTLVVDMATQQVYATYRAVVSAQAQVRVLETRMQTIESPTAGR